MTTSITTTKQKKTALLANDLMQLKGLLMSTQQPMTRIKDELDLNDVKGLATQFKEATGLSPMAFRHRYGIVRKDPFTKKGRRQDVINGGFINLSPPRSGVKHAIISLRVTEIIITDNHGNVQSLPIMTKHIAISVIHPCVTIGPFYINVLGRTSTITLTHISNRANGSDGVGIQVDKTNDRDQNFTLSVKIEETYVVVPPTKKEAKELS